MPHSTFDAFVPDARSRSAYEAAIAVAERPGRVHNPLFLQGPCGSGKSHLLRAIEQRMPADANVVRLATDAFVMQFVDAIRSDSLDAFRDEVRSYDALLLDDFRIGPDRPRVQEELSHHLRDFVARGAQVVVASDFAVDRFVPRLRELFHAGLVVELGHPDVDARVEIARRAAVAHGLTLSEETLRRVAQSGESARELHSAVARIAAEALL